MRAATISATALLAAALALPLASAARADLLIAIDKSTQHMSVVVDGAQRYTWPVSTGRAGYDTPSGTFRPNRMDADHFSQEWDNAPMPHTVFFDMHGHAIHGFFDVKHLGLPVSHGCVRLSPDNAAVLFDLIKTEKMANTTVIVSGQTPGGRGPAMAQQPMAQQPMAQQPMAQQPAPQPVAGDPAQSYGRPAYGQPAYGQPVYRQPYGQGYQGNYVQPSYGQSYYGQSYYGQPAYRQW
jgi:hypothetical protein